MAATPEVRMNRSIDRQGLQLQKSSTKAPSSSALARLANGEGSARTASIASAARAMCSASTAPRTHTAPSRWKSLRRFS